MSVTPVLSVKDLTINYDNFPAVDNISFDVQEGDCLGIVGPNGAGKTTLFRAILGLQSFSGNMKLFGYENPKYSSIIPLIGYVPQKVTFEPNFPATVYDVVSMGLISDKRIVQGVKLIQQCDCCWNRIYQSIEKNDDKITQALHTVGLESLRNRRIGELSGGELQRVLLSHALVNKPNLLLLDEATRGLDQSGSASFYRKIEEIRNDTGCAVLMISHDLHVVMGASDRVICLNGHICCQGAPDSVASSPEYKALFGSELDGTLALYKHKHDHHHDRES